MKAMTQEQWSSVGGSVAPPPGDIWPCLETLLVVTTWVGGATGI